VIKVGSSLVTNEGRGLDEAAIGEWCRQMALLARATMAARGGHGVQRRRSPRA
jgi:glutamate 5-kinase